LTPQSEAGNGADRWFGLIRNVVLAANIVAALEFASIHFWTARNYSVGIDLYRNGQIGAIWSAAQVLLIAVLALANYAVACRKSDGLRVFWLIAGGGALCMGLDQLLMGHRYLPMWTQGPGGALSDAATQQMGALIFLAAALAGALLGRVYSQDLAGRPRFIYYWNWGVGLALFLGVVGALQHAGMSSEFTTMISRATLIPEAFFMLAFFSEVYAKATARPQEQGSEAPRAPELAPSPSG
jgi:hypothetical protein